MDSIRNFFRNRSGYSRRERRSTFILLNIILILTGIRYIFPVHETSVREIPIEILESENQRYVIEQEEVEFTSQKRPKEFPGKRKVIELNKCDSAALVALPGIGPVLSARIIKYRNLLGGYVSATQLREVYGLPEETFILISSFITADSLMVSKIRINQADYRELIRHPYLDRTGVSNILKYRELKGRITDLQAMVENNLITPATAVKIQGYLDFSY
jgi:DNA uptake protein ComE-like DNA-binding protein